MSASPSLKGFGPLNSSRHRRVPVGARFVLRVEGADTTLCDHGLDLLGRECLLEQVDKINFHRVEQDVACDEQLVRRAEAEELEGPHKPFVLLGSFTHFEEFFPGGGL